MAKFSVSVRPYKCSARPKAKWVLNVWHPTGKRERSYFETKETAQAAGQLKKVDVARLGWRALQIDDRLRLEALDANEKLTPYGVSLTAVVAEYIRRRGSSSVTVNQIAEKFIASRLKLNRSEKHLSSLRRLFVRFGDSFPSERLADLTSDQVEGWLHQLRVGPVTVNTYRSLLHSLFEFGLRKKLCPENPVKAVERMTVKADDVGILTIEQTQFLLENSAADVRATIALGAFAGIRPEEIVRLVWEDIDLEEGLIDIGAEIRMAQDKFDDSLSDLRRFREFAPQDPNADYACLWIWLIQVQQNQKAEADRELSAALSETWNASPGDGVSQNARFLLDQINETEFLAAAVSLDQKEDQRRHCEAWYYAGMKRLLTGERDTAADDFRKCLATGNSSFSERIFARAQLNALNSR